MGFGQKKLKNQKKVNRKRKNVDKTTIHSMKGINKAG
jgi:hypothetical protein